MYQVAMSVLYWPVYIMIFRPVLIHKLGHSEEKTFLQELLAIFSLVKLEKEKLLETSRVWALKVYQ